MVAHADNDMDRCVANLQLALPHYREAARIDRANNHVDGGDQALCNVADIEEKLRQIGIARASAATATMG